jgi:hypothetical protein
MIIDSNVLVRLLVSGYARGKCVAHNWKRNPFPDLAVVIWDWCNTQNIGWGEPSGYAVQDAQRMERMRPVSRIAAHQETRGHRRIMFSLSQSENPAAFACAQRLARQHGFILLP